ncbi:uracil-DNA glycosylase family 4 [Hoeflea halophila]|uniref:Type-5 uracil-DNA glycosylase n=1 Tax=Hoeflea halophila TaxID=714899 RepID=A0A286HMD5_9HYPH|nr:uracil-DNA glycosylase [Hoeflea halophila]SOE08887.1 uracil-DNA glycosylase family 4 [Hoeflea halophila]
MRSADNEKNEPDYDCSLCPRLRGFILQNRQRFPDWHNGPVENWYPSEGPNSAQLLIVGLAPGLRGANRTGIPFTGDDSGSLLFETLSRFGFAFPDPGLASGANWRLRATAITNAVRFVPPANKPTAAEINTCREFLSHTIQQMHALRIIVTLGKIAHDSTIRALGGKISRHPFAHAAQTELSGLTLISSYHCSRYNINTGRLTAEMFDAVFRKAARSLGIEQSPAPSHSTTNVPV